MLFLSVVIDSLFPVEIENNFPIDVCLVLFNKGFDIQR